MAALLARGLLATIDLDDKKFRSKLNESYAEAKSWAENTSVSLSSIGKAFDSSGIDSIIGKVINATVVQEAALNQLQYSLAKSNDSVGVSFQELTKYAADLQGATTFADEEVIRAQTQLISLTSITGNEFLRATDLAADLAVRMGGDMGAAAQKLGAALSDPVNNLSSLGAAGVRFTSEQESVIKSLVKTGDAAQAQKLILNQLEAQIGGTARAVRDTFGGALQGLNNAFGNLLEADGKSLPSAKNAVEELTAVLEDPLTKDAADEVTGAIVKGFSWAAKTIATTVNVAKFAGEEIAAHFNLAAVGDMIRLQDQLADRKEKLDEINSRKDSRSNAGYSKKKEITEEIVELQRRIDLTRELNELKFREQSNNSQASIQPESGSGTLELPNTTLPVDPYEEMMAGMERQIELYGKTAQAVQLRYDLEHDRISGLEELTAGEIDGLVEKAARIDELTAAEGRKREADEAKQAEKDSLSNEVTSIEESLEAQNLSIEEAYLRRSEIIKNALDQELITKTEHEGLKAKLDQDMTKKQIELSSKGFSTLLSIAERYYEGDNSKKAQRARMAIKLGKVALDAEKRDAIKSIAITTWATAMKAYNALAGIPYVGPFLGAAAAGVVIAAGAAYGATVAGVAHGGLDYVPKEQTFLLDRGERVVSPKQNRDLTSFLNSERTTGGGNVEVVINEAPGVQTNVTTEQIDGKTRVVVDQQVREIVRDELHLQQSPGGLLDKSYTI